MEEIRDRDELVPTNIEIDFFSTTNPIKITKKGKEYILEYKQYPSDYETRKAVAYYLGPENDRSYAPKIIENSMWYIPSEPFGRQGKQIYRAPMPYETNRIKVFEVPTRAKELMAESLLRQKLSIELPEEIKASLRKSIRNRGGKRRKSKNTKKTRRSHKKYNKSYKKKRGGQPLYQT